MRARLIITAHMFTTVKRARRRDSPHASSRRAADQSNGRQTASHGVCGRVSALVLHLPLWPVDWFAPLSDVYTLSRYGLFAPFVRLWNGPANGLADQPLRALRLRERFGIMVVTVTRTDGEVLHHLSADTVLRRGDRARVFGLPAQIEAFESLLRTDNQ